MTRVVGEDQTREHRQIEQAKASFRWQPAFAAGQLSLAASVRCRASLGGSDSRASHLRPARNERRVDLCDEIVEEAREDGLGEGVAPIIRLRRL